MNQFATAMTLTALVTWTACGGSPTPPPRPGPTPPTTDAGANGPTEAATNRVVRLANGISAFVAQTSVEAETQVQLGVLAGALFVAPGLSELAAEVILHSSDPTTGNASLATTITQLGGTIEVEVGLLTTWFDLRVPRGKGRSALDAIRQALQSASRSRNQIERMRDELIQRICGEVTRAPLAGSVRALLLAEPSTEAYVNGLLDLDASQVTLFLERLYRPERCVLHYQEGYPLAQLVRHLHEPAERAIEGWLPAPPTPGTIELLPRSFEGGVTWIESMPAGARGQVAIVLRRPQAGEVVAAEFLLLQSVLTLDGSGGRLEALQEQAGLGHVRWQAELVQLPDAEALLLTTEATADEAAQLWRLVQRARQSLLEVPPTPSELQLAFRRARLAAELPLLDAAARLRQQGLLAVRQMPLDVVHHQLEALQRRGAFDAATAARVFAEQPLWMVVVGPPQPPGLTAHAARVLPPRLHPAPGTTPPTPSAGEPTPWLDRALATCGGRARIASLVGFHGTSTLQPGDAPAVLDEVDWHVDGTLSRRRTVLGQVVTTELVGNNWAEEVGGVRQSLTAEDAAVIRNEMARHPLMLLAAHARGQLAFRAVAEREVGDRRMMVLEAKDERFERLRVHLDVQSSLVRVVETWQRFADGSVVHVHETWHDYRDVGDLRVPHLRRASWNDGQHESESTFAAWRPEFAAR